MQLAAPSLPVTPSLPPGAKSAADSAPSVRPDKNSAPRDSFAKIMSDDKAASSDADKKTKRASDRAALEAAAIFGWMQSPVPTAAATVTILAGGTATTASDAEVTTDCTQSAAAAGSTSAQKSAGFGTLNLTASEVSLAAAPALNASSAAIDSVATAQNAAVVSTASTSPSPVLAASLTAGKADATMATSDKNTSVFAANNLQQKAEALALTDAATSTAAALTDASPQGMATPTSATTLATSNPILAAQLTAEQALTSTNQLSGPTAATAITSAKAIGATTAARAKIAPLSANLTDPVEKAPGGLEKNFLNADEEPVVAEVSELGIDAAKPVDNMSPATAHRSFFAANDRDGLSAVTTTNQSSADVATTAASDAHRAVDAVLLAGECLSATGQGVNLQFNLGSADLAVRVEMRGGELHATFRTNSPELRSALATEWQAAAAQDAASPLRMVEPTFAGSNSSNLADQSQNFSSAQDRNSNSKNPSTGDFDFMRSFSGSSDEGSIVPSEPRVARPALGYNQHLHAFA